MSTQNLQNTLKPNQIEALDNEHFSNFLYTASIPNPDIMIRTGGDKRLSNYLLWQLAEARLVFVDTLWPDFSEKDLAGVIDLNTISS